MLRAKIILFMGCIGLTSMCAAADTTVQALVSVDAAVQSGYTMLVRKENSILARVDSGSPRSDEQVWWLVFNNPEACAARPCSLDDIYRRETRADLIPADEKQRAHSETGDMCLQAGQGSRSLMPRFGMPANGLTDVASAEIQLLVAGVDEHMEAWVRRATSDLMRSCAGASCDSIKVAVHTPRG